MKTFLSVLVTFSVVAMSVTVRAEGLPEGCSYSMISLASVSGSPAYVRLRYEIEALSSAQQSVELMHQGIKDYTAASEASTKLSAIITSTNDASNALLCSAAIMDRYKSTDKDDTVIKELMVQAFGTESNVVMGLQADLKRQILIAVGQADPKTDVAKDAENQSQMTEAQNHAAESLTIAVTESLLKSVDMSDPKAKNTAKLLISCSEFKDLRKESAAVMGGGTRAYRGTAVMGGERSAYRDDAGLFVSFLNGHECKAVTR